MTAIESEIANFWKETLHVEDRVKAEDNFFQLGGHSLHTMHLKHFISQKYKVDVSIKSIFENQTIASISQLIASKMPLQNGEAENIEPTINGREIDQIWDGTPLPLNGWMDAERSAEDLSADVPVENQLMPLSYGEESLWLVHQLQQNKTVYNEINAFKIIGSLNIDALEKSLRQLVMHHDSLRKKFIEVGGTVKAYIEPKPDFSLRRILFSPSSVSSNFENYTQEILLEESNTPFDLANDLPIRATLIENSNEYVLVLALHHIVTDGWSFMVLKEDLSSFYHACILGERVEKPSLSKDYFNYPFKERDRLEGRVLQNLSDFWLNHLRGKIEKLKLPVDRQTSTANYFDGAYEEVEVPSSLINGLNALSRAKGVTLFMTMLTAFHALLHRYTKNKNVLTGIPFAGRQEDDTKAMIGFFVNTLLLTTDFTGDPTFDSVLFQTRNNVIDAHEHQDMPFELLATMLRKETGIDANELIQVMFAFQSVPETNLKLDGVKCEWLEPLKTTAKFDLLISIVELEGPQHRVVIEYRKVLFNASTIQRMLRHFLVLLDSVIKNPNETISKLEFVSENEKDVIINQWNNTARDIPALAIHELFERQAVNSLTREAISYDTRVLTYAELNKRANQLAHHLIGLGITSEDVVGVLMNETEEAIISLLAILKAGGAYLPLDTSYPKDRLIYMLENSGAKVVITNKSFQSHLDGHSFKQVLLDQQKEEIFQGDDTNPVLQTRPDQLAYVIYTSGSTGKPKGVAIEHRGVVRLLINSDWVTFNAETRLLKTAAFSFDVSVMEIWGTLLHGGRLFLYSRNDLLDHEFLKSRISQEQINTMYFTSPWLSQLVEIDPTIFGPLKILIGGGDKLSAKHLNKLVATYPGLKIINAYGPTENSVWSTYYNIEGEQTEPVLIGKSIPNSTAYILDDSLQILPIGIEGEICLGGPGVARGYLNNEEKTKEKFIDDPFHPGGRLYKTGDSGRWLEDGNIEFFGRKDNQIKLRGYRVELGEIELAMVAHPKVDDCIVVVTGKDDNDKHLVCYYLSPQEIPSGELKSFLRESLPDHMIPSKFVRVDNFPLTHNGKVNRQALSSRVEPVVKETATQTFLQNPVEVKLLRIWEDVLGKKGITPSDNFFQLGGHSLLATKLMARVKIVFDQTFPVSLLFRAPTVRDFAAVISKDINLKKSNLVPIQPKGNQTPFFVIPGFLFYYHLAKYLGNDQPLYGFEPIPGKPTEEVATIYIQQMQTIQPEGPYYIGGYCAGGIVAYEMARQLVEAGHRVGLLALFEVYTPEGVVNRTSMKYVREKLFHLVDKFRVAPTDQRFNILFKEFKKLFKGPSRTSEDDYIIKPYLGHIFLFKAMEGMVGSRNEPYMGWNNYCDVANLEVIEVPGNHDTMFKEPHVPTAAARLEECLYKRRVMMVEEEIV